MWFFLALFFALWTSASVAISKRILQRVSPTTMSAMGILSVPFMYIIVLSTTGIPKVDQTFWIAAFLAALLNVFASLSSFTAIKHAPISLIMPISSFNPVFTTLFSMIVLSEVPSFTKFLGILIIVIGAYLLHISDISYSLLRPFSKLFSNRYVLLFLFANLLWAITPLFEKIAIQHTSPKTPLFVGIVSFTFLAGLLIPVITNTVKNPLQEMKENFFWFLLLAPFSAVAIWAAFTAYSQAHLGYVTAIFKLSTLFTILFGAFFFKEERIEERLLGAGVMLLGTILLVL